MVSLNRLTDTVITPFRRNSSFSSTGKRQRFNKYFSGFRVRIEHCFGVLKERFPSLKELRVRIKDAKSHKFVCQWILVCGILHNIFIPYDDEDDIANIIENLELDPEPDPEPGVRGEITGDLKRQVLFSAVIQSQ